MKKTGGQKSRDTLPLNTLFIQFLTIQKEVEKLVLYSRIEWQKGQNENIFFGLWCPTPSDIYCMYRLLASQKVSELIRDLSLRKNMNFKLKI